MGYLPPPPPKEERVAYLNCPTCRLTVYTSGLSFEECPRCRAKLGRVSRLFRSPLPPRLQKSQRAQASKPPRSA
jgi:ssDNA-binding Zn-finger/Zn-ribbon topoisomerase 1